MRLVVLALLLTGCAAAPATAPPTPSATVPPPQPSVTPAELTPAAVPTPVCEAWFIEPVPDAQGCPGPRFGYDATWQTFDGGILIAAEVGPTVHYRVLLGDGTYRLVVPGDGTLGWMTDEVTAALAALDLAPPPEGRTYPAQLLILPWVGELTDEAIDLYDRLGWPTAPAQEFAMRQQFMLTTGEAAVSYFTGPDGGIYRTEALFGTIEWEPVSP
ncbi:MAG: hypothetical protein GYB64_00450 [Chloroflexi bacterium]|nr:hypothetical protein [Chloroflexota bacterium]